MTEKCDNCGQVTLGKIDFRTLSLSIDGSAWRKQVKLCPDCLQDALDEFGVEPPAEVIEA